MHYSAMNQMIMIEEGYETANELGESVMTWRNIGQYLAKIEILFNKRQIGHEMALDRRIVNINYFEITMRYTKLHCKMRIIWQGRVLNILKVFDRTNRGKFIQAIVEENS